MDQQFGWLPYADTPEVDHDTITAAGWLSTANQRVHDADYPHFITQDWAPPWRQQRIEQLFLRFARIGRDFYAQEQTRVGQPFWARRQGWPDAQPLHLTADWQAVRVARQPVFIAALANNVVGSVSMMFIMTAAPLAAPRGGCAIRAPASDAAVEAAAGAPSTPTVTSAAVASVVAVIIFFMSLSCWTRPPLGRSAGEF